MFKYFASLYALFFENQEIANLLAILPIRQKMRFFARVVWQPAIASAWLEYILSEPLCYCGKGRPLYRRLQKPLRIYLNRAFTGRERLLSLQDHYDCLKQIFRPDQANFLAIKGSELAIAAFSCKKQVSYELVLAETDHFDREGEFRLTLREVGTQKQITVIAFSLGTMPERRFDIGCIQGHDAGGAELARSITRDFYGMRPKNLLMFALYDLAEAWNVRAVRGIDNTRRIYKIRKCLFVTGRKYAEADYEVFWKELGGAYQGGGWFNLPYPLPQKRLEEVPSKHRSEHRRRLQLREDIRSQILALLSS